MADEPSIHTHEVAERTASSKAGEASPDPAAEPPAATPAPEGDGAGPARQIQPDGR